MKRLALMAVVIVIAGCLFGRAALAQEVRASVDRTHIGLDQSVRLTVTITGGEGEVDPRPITDFKVLPEATSTRIQIVNGRTTHEKALNYTLMPLKEGRLTIPPLTATIGAKAFQTREIMVEVSGHAPVDTSRRDVFVTARVSKENPYLGEAIVFYLRLYNAVRIADPAVETLPTFEGFSAKPLENRDAYRDIVNGREYLVRELAFVLTPLAAGKHTLSAAVIRLDVYAPNSRSKPGTLERLFDDPFFSGGRRETVRLRSDPISVSVRSLPADAPGAPRFSGLVGRFKMDSALEKNRLAVGDATTLSVTVTGEGNLMDAETPEIRIPQGLKSYSDAPEEAIRLTPDGYSGKKTFRIALVGIEPGTYDIGPVNIRSFNPAAEAYETLSADAVPITVSPSAEHDTFKVASAEAPRTPGKANPMPVEFTGRDILPIREDLHALTHQGGIGFPQFALLLAAPILLCAAAWGWRRWTRPTDDPAAVMAKRAKAALAAAEQGPQDTFGSELSRALMFAILSRAAVKGESLTYREAEETLRSAGLDPEFARSAGKLLDRIDSARYGGQGPDAGQRTALLKETRAMIREVIQS
jgi:hypothetical protein